MKPDNDHKQAAWQQRDAEMHAQAEMKAAMHAAQMRAACQAEMKAPIEETLHDGAAEAEAAEKERAEKMRRAMVLRRAAAKLRAMRHHIEVQSAYIEGFKIAARLSDNSANHGANYLGPFGAAASNGPGELPRELEAYAHQLDHEAGIHHRSDEASGD